MSKPIAQYVLGFAMNPTKTRVLLLVKETPQWQKGLINGIGGKKEPGESALEAMQREFREETGLITDITQWKSFGQMGSEYFQVDLFWTTMTEAELSQHQSLTAERVGLYDFSLLLEHRFHRCMPNLPWILGALLDPELEKIYLNVTYQAS